MGEFLPTLSGTHQGTRSERFSGAERGGFIEQFNSAGEMRVSALKSVTRARYDVTLSALSPEWYSGERGRVVRKIVGEAERRGVAVRELYHRDDLPHWCTPEYLLSAAERDSQVRITDTKLQELVIVDSQVAFMRTQVGPSQEHYLATWAPPLIKNLQSLLAAAWNGASEPLSYLRHLRSDFDDADRQIINELAFGRKDEVAARRLGISLRTYRRRVAEIMSRLDANSRFQAGVHALRDGLVSWGGREEEFLHPSSA
ncbi:hypothetical protein ACFCV8_20515 [Streptomyces sp. NPDC056347]|uniref:helix-turn-helix transcriptional regulator n=1 Tax=unclassified Streptomyces TaxID=2593676 RepID=UPI0035D78A90